MSDAQLISQLMELVAQMGLGAVFLWLLIREMNAHERTRQAYYADMRRCIEDYKRVATDSPTDADG